MRRLLAAFAALALVLTLVPPECTLVRAAAPDAAETVTVGESFADGSLERALYAILKKQFERTAAGEVSSTAYDITFELFFELTGKDKLGEDAENTLRNAAAAKAALPADVTRAVWRAVCADLPYERYWSDGTAVFGNVQEWPETADEGVMKHTVLTVTAPVIRYYTTNNAVGKTTLPDILSEEQGGGGGCRACRKRH